MNAVGMIAVVCGLAALVILCMLARGVMRRRAVVRHGRSAPAEVVEAKVKVGSEASTLFELRLEVRPPDGSSFRAGARAVVPRRQVPFVRPGARAQVKYDPGNPSRVVVESIGDESEMEVKTAMSQPRVQACAKCAGKVFAVMPRFQQPHQESSNSVLPLPPLTVEVSWKSRKQLGRFETWVCMGCGYTEFYALDLAGVEELATQHPDQVRIVELAAPNGPRT